MEAKVKAGELRKWNALLYSIVLQWKLDIRSRSLLVTCYIVPLMFFLLMGSLFTSVMPEMKETLIFSMIVMGVSMGALIGLPPSLAEAYGSDIKKLYRANGVPLCFGLAAMVISTFIHLTIMSIVIVLLAPVLFDAKLPAHLPSFFMALGIFTAVSLSVGGVLGLAVKNQAKLAMAEQFVFLPSILLSGIMFPSGLLPDFLEALGKAFPAFWGYRLMMNHGLLLENLWYLALVFFTAVLLCVLLMNLKNL